jgi:hypothetical protein
MGYVHQDLVSNYHWYQVMANAIAGGRINVSDTGASNAFGGFALTGSTGGTTGNCHVTWAADYSGTPVVVAQLEVPASSDINARVIPYGVGPSSCGFRFVNTGTTGVSTNFAQVLVFGSATGTRHS